MEAQSKTGKPVKWKLFLLVWVAVYPLILGLSKLLALLQLGFPGWLNTMLISIVLVSLMLFLIMPFINSSFSKWLSQK